MSQEPTEVHAQMQIGELLASGKAKKGQRVTVRVPAAKLKALGIAEKAAKTGEPVTVQGAFLGLMRSGRVVTVQVDVKGKTHGFRPQDVSLT